MNRHALSMHKFVENGIVRGREPLAPMLARIPYDIQTRTDHQKIRVLFLRTSNSFDSIDQSFAYVT